MENQNTPLKEGFTQVCIWPMTSITDYPNPSEEDIKEFTDWMQGTFGLPVQFLEELVLNEGTGIIFAIRGEDTPKFALPRLDFGIRWIEDATDPGNGPMMPARIHDYRTDRGA